MNRSCVNSVLLSGVALVLPLTGLAPPAHAQAAQTAPSAQTPGTLQIAQTVAPSPASQTALTTASPQGASVNEIVVTANKREEKLNKVGLTVTALSAQTLAEHNVTSLADIASLVPGLSFAHSPSNTPVLTLRGVGYNSTALGSYPAVSVYVDEAPLPFSVLASHSAYDLQRVEVLKGPQGTLFGENATGGAINFIAAKPTPTFESGADITYGRFNQTEANAYVSGPISDTLRVRLSGTGVNSDGWQISDSRPDDRNGRLDYAAGRMLVDWDASGRIRFSLNLNGWVDKSQPQAAQFIAMHPVAPGFLTPGELAAPFSPQNPQAADWSTGARRPRSDREFVQAALRTDIDLPSGVTLTSLTSYDHFIQRQTQDDDGLPLNIDDFDENGHIYSFNQELRLTSSPRSHLRWIVGGNYENTKTLDFQAEYYTDSSIAKGFGFDSSDQQSRQNIRNFAFFGDVDYDFTSKLTGKAGIRYTNTRNNASLCGADAGDGLTAAAFNYLGSLSGHPFTPVGFTGPIESRCTELNPLGVPNLTPNNLTLAESNVPWRVGLDYRLSSDVLLYANISRGYKSGGFPTISATIAAEFAPVTQESVTSYETGVKADFFRRKVHLNAAVFYYDYRNKQALGKIIDPTFGAEPALVNVPKSRIYGLDSDISVRPIPGLTFTGSLTYLNSRIQQDFGYSTFAATASDLMDFSGSRLPFTPEWNYGLDVEYRHRLGNEGTPFAGLSVEGQSSQDTSIGSGDLVIPAAPGARTLLGLTYPFTTNAYATLDARLGYEAPSGAWKVMAFGKNILNKYYWTNVTSQSDAYARYAGLPATYGVTFSVKFH